MDVSVIIVSYNTRDLTISCVASVVKELSGISHEVIVVDNASADGTAEALRQELPGVTVIRNPVNSGFGTGCNIGYRASSGRFIFLLNSDATISRDSVNKLMDAAALYPEAGLFGPKIVSPAGEVVRSCFRFTTPWRYALHHTFFGWTKVSWHDERGLSGISKVDWLTGCCVLIRREVYERTCGFDENIFLFSEETDLMWRAARLGYQTLFVPSAVCVHIGGASTKVSSTRRYGIMMRSDLYITRKHYGVAAATVAMFSRFTSGLAKAPVFLLLNALTGFKDPRLLDRFALARANLRYAFFPIPDPRNA